MVPSSYLILFYLLYYKDFEVSVMRIESRQEILEICLCLSRVLGYSLLERLRDFYKWYSVSQLTFYFSPSSYQPWLTDYSLFMHRYKSSVFQTLENFKNWVWNLVTYSRKKFFICYELVCEGCSVQCVTVVIVASVFKLSQNKQ